MWQLLSWQSQSQTETHYRWVVRWTYFYSKNVTLSRVEVCASTVGSDPAAVLVAQGSGDGVRLVHSNAILKLCVLKGDAAQAWLVD